jgi:hypothetical protein
MKMLLELMKRIRDEFTSSRLELISQIDISEEEYGWLLTYVREKTKISHIPTIASADEVLSVAMVQIAIKVYSDGNYWDCFNEEIGFVLTPPKKAYFSQVFVETIRKYEMFELRSKNDLRQAYVENIKAHAFVPNKYLENFRVNTGEIDSKEVIALESIYGYNYTIDTNNLYKKASGFDKYESYYVKNYTDNDSYVYEQVQIADESEYAKYNGSTVATTLYVKSYPNVRFYWPTNPKLSLLHLIFEKIPDLIKKPLRSCHFIITEIHT